MLTEIIREACIALRRNYTRSLLTMLGIVWGIATVTLLIAYGSSFRNILVSGFDAFGKSVVICWPQQTSEQPGGQRAGKKVVLEKADVEIAFNLLANCYEATSLTVPSRKMEPLSSWEARLPLLVVS